MEGSDVIIAINSDEKAPIMEFSNYALIGNAAELLPALTEAFRERIAPRGQAGSEDMGTGPPKPDSPSGTRPDGMPCGMPSGRRDRARVGYTGSATVGRFALARGDMSEKFDVIVVGAGPAGNAAA